MGKTKQYTQRYKKEWEKEATFRGWLQPVDGDDFHGRCKYCKTVIASRKKDLEDHSKTEKHKRNSVGSKSSKITEAFPKILDSHDAAVKKAEIRTALYVAEHGTNASVDHLGEVISALDPKSSILKDLKIHRTKCSGMINHILGPMVHEQLLADMKNSYFSLIIDESTDVSDKQCLGVMVKYFSKTQKKVVTTLYRLIELESTTADAITEAILQALEQDKLPVGRLVGIGVDGASAMVGRHHSVSTLLAEKVPHLIVVRCLCHSLHLAASAACALFPRHLDYMVRESHNWFSQSPKRQREYTALYKAMNDGKTNQKIPKVAETRWLSRGAAVEKVLEQYEELKLTFMLAKDRDRCYQADQLYQMYLDKRNHLYLTFLSSQLKALNRINRIFQSANLDPCAAHRDLEQYLRSLLDMVVMPAFLKGVTSDDLITFDASRHAIPARAMFFGHEFSLKECDVPDEARLGIREKCREFVLKLVAEVQKRLPNNVSLLSDLAKMSPESALKVCGRPSVVSIAASFQAISGSPDDVEREWNSLHRENWESCKDGRIDRERFWAEVGELKMADEELRYPNIFLLGTALMSAPVSNACVERLFSLMNVVKTKQRNRMQTRMTESILRIRCFLHAMGKTCVDYEIPDQAVRLFKSDVIYDGEWPEGL